MQEPILKVNDLTMQFGGVVALNNFSMDIYEGEIVALIGPNGAGKTTAFNAITGIYEPTNGSILFNGKKVIENYPHGKMKKTYNGENLGKYREVITKTPDKLTDLGMARTFQNIRLFKSMTVFENVLAAKHMRKKAGFFASAFHLDGKEEQRLAEEALHLLTLVDLADVKDELATSLPYGKQRKLEIARALATDPKLLLLDEPAAGMNPQETEELTEFIRRVHDEFNVTIFLIEHHMNLVMDISDRIYVIDFGKLICTGTPQEVQSDQRVIDAYLGVGDIG